MEKLLFIIPFILLSFNSTLKAQIISTDWKEKKLNHKATHPYLQFEVSTSKFNAELKLAKQKIRIPNPTGKFETFEITPVTVVSEEVADQYTVKTYRGFKIDDPLTVIACDISNLGFHAAIYDHAEAYYIEPVETIDPNKLKVYYNKHKSSSKIKCLSKNLKSKIKPDYKSQEALSTKRTFRLAISATGEYSQEFSTNSDSVTNVLNSIASGVNLLNPIFLRDLGVDFKIVSGESLVFLNPDSDPYELLSDELLTVSHNECVLAMGASGFDVGHLVAWSDAGGFASFETVCNNDYKGEGFSSNNESVVTLWIDYVAHELGHQFGSEHNFSGCEYGSVSGFRYEPGEGSTIMCYASLCKGYVKSSDPYFHNRSIDQIRTFVSTTFCGSSFSIGNSSDPLADAKSGITIPKQTPFILVGSASDQNDEAKMLTYSWQQDDGDGPMAIGNPDCKSRTSPLFRYRVPLSENFRTFPEYSKVLIGDINNRKSWEVLPCVSRTLNFSLTVRDNNQSFGRLTSDYVSVTVADTGPFEVTSPNGNENLTGSTVVLWEVNETDSHCPYVDILLSSDGGESYDVLADAIPNNGRHNIIFNSTSTEARVLIRCDVPSGFRSATTFFDVSDDNFSMTEAVVDNDNDNFDNTVDCDDSNPAINSDATEVCNRIDDNCDGVIDETFEYFSAYFDSDGDGFGDLNSSISFCSLPQGYVINSDDCDDSNIDINPDAIDVPNNDIDENCNGADLISSLYEIGETILNIYPNPTSDKVYINADGPLSYQSMLYDISGKNLYVGENNTSIDVSKFSAGTYILKIVDIKTNHSINEKIVLLK